MKKTLLLTLLTLSLATANAADLHQREASRSQNLGERAEWKEGLDNELCSGCDSCGGGDKDCDRGPKGAVVSGTTIYTSHPGIIYYAIAVTPTGSEVTLIDGSVWQVRSWDKNLTLNWLATDEIIILPNTSFFSLYDYKLLNRVTGAEVEANMILQPLLGAAYTRQVTGFNDNYYYIYLTDGSVWEISSYDLSLYRSWMIGDIILIGANTGWDSNIRPNVLINATHHTYIRANCIQ